MKKLLILFLLASLFCTACKSREEAKLIPEEISPQEINKNQSSLEKETIFPYTFTDSLQKEVTVEQIQRVVIVYGSFAEVWLNAGGSFIGTTEDFITERGKTLNKDTTIVGTVKEPNLELILSLNPDFVILSADISSHTSLADTLNNMGISNASMRIDTFEDYLKFLRISCDMTGREDLYKANGTSIKLQIEEVLAQIPKDESRTVLLLRAYSTGIKAKTDDNFTGIMLQEFGLTNIALKHPSLLEDLSMETIILEDPDFIFVTTMGAEENALQALKDSMESDPAFGSLKAVKEGHYSILPKDLFHYKPNARWGESYQYLAELIYGDKLE